MFKRKAEYSHCHYRSVGVCVICLGIALSCASGCSGRTADLCGAAPEARASGNGRHDGNSVRDRLWERYEQAIDSIEYTDESVFKEGHAGSQYWLEVLEEANRILWPFMRAASEDNLEWLFAQFGQHGDLADFGLLFSVPLLTMPGSPIAVLNKESQGIAGKELQLKEIYQLQPKELYQLQLRSSRALLKVVLSDNSLLRRYYHAVLWEGMFLKAGSADFFGGALSSTASRMAKAGDDECTWYARDVLLLAFAVGREKDIRASTAQELRQSWTALYGWCRDNGNWLRFDAESLRWRPRAWAFLAKDKLVPDVLPHPFPGWTLPSSPTRNVFFHYQWHRKP